MISSPVALSNLLLENCEAIFQQSLLTDRDPLVWTIFKRGPCPSLYSWMTSNTRQCSWQAFLKNLFVVIFWSSRAEQNERIFWFKASFLDTQLTELFLDILLCKCLKLGYSSPVPPFPHAVSAARGWCTSMLLTNLPASAPASSQHCRVMPRGHHLCMPFWPAVLLSVS